MFAAGAAAAMERGFDRVAEGGRYVPAGVVKDRIGFRRRGMTMPASRNAEDFGRAMAAIRGGAVAAERMATRRTTLAGAAADVPRRATGKAGPI